MTTEFREAIRNAFDAIGGLPTFSAWAKQNQTEFYRICSRLIPIELRGDLLAAMQEKTIVIVDRSKPLKEQPAMEPLALEDQSQDSDDEAAGGKTV